MSEQELTREALLADPRVQKVAEAIWPGSWQDMPTIWLRRAHRAITDREEVFEAFKAGYRIGAGAEYLEGDAKNEFDAWLQEHRSEPESKCYCDEPDVYDGYAECPAHPDAQATRDAHA